MKSCTITKWFICIFLLTIAIPLLGSTWTAWTEDPSDPIYNPGKAYYPSVLFDANKFNDNSAFYKMWYEGDNEIGLAYSNDGINWTTQTTTGLPAVGAHPDVLFDENGFGGSGYNYRMWFWDPSKPIDSISAIQFSMSTDGVNWTAPISVSQYGLPLVTGISPGYFYHLYGPGYVIYNPDAITPVPGQPYTFPYVMFFDTATESPTITIPSIEQTGLAYSTDGINWTRYGLEPILIPSGNIAEWDGQYIYQPSVILVQGVYHMFYSGSNGQPIGSDGNTTAHGIGHASSSDGINWVKDSDNPIFYILDGVSWRNNRTYTPSVIFDPFCTSGSCPTCFAKMWFSGANSSDIRAIGYATLPCPPLPAPLPPSNFTGVVIKNKFLNKTECVLEAKWTASPSADVVFYRIYKNGVVVAEIPATSPLIYVTCLQNCSAAGYSITAVDSNNLESTPVILVMVNV